MYKFFKSVTASVGNNIAVSFGKKFEKLQRDSSMGRNTYTYVLKMFFSWDCFRSVIKYLTSITYHNVIYHTVIKLFDKYSNTG